ncbi:hypothetical protein [Mesoaciditoga lauensis]|uniref:hypothetical protein n=1 Tax=Mesoaciditoga lauensis TaxID=1495039 RepID=UPI00056891B4|nr:hypothetical protein [Mesoaciditoga lauensis]
MKKVLILTVIAILALGVIAIADSVGPTCEEATLTVTSNIYVLQGFEATATGYDATFCGATGYLLKGHEAVDAAHGSSFPQIVLYDGGPYGPGSGIGDDDLVLSSLSVMSNYNKVKITIDISGVPSDFRNILKIAVSTNDDNDWSNPSYVGNSSSGILTLHDTNGGSPYKGFLFIYTVYTGTPKIFNGTNQGSNQIAPWVEAGKYSITFKFTISPDFTF